MKRAGTRNVFFFTWPTDHSHARLSEGNFSRSIEVQGKKKKSLSCARVLHKT